MERIFTFIRNNIRLLLGTAVVIFAAALIVSLVLNKRSPQVTVNGQSFTVVVARSEKDRQIGLSKTEKLDDNQGMLFVFDNPGYYPFWMKEMKFAIDIIYIQNNKVTTVFENANPPTSTDGNLEIYEPTEKSDKVLELKAGSAKKHNIKKGTSVKIENL